MLIRFRAAACEAPVRADLRTRGAGLRGAKLRPAAVPFRNRKFMIQNSRFKINWGCLGILPDSGCSLRSARTKRTCGTRAAARYALRAQFKIQDSKLRNSGCSPRRARSKQPCGTRAAGLRRPQAAARRSLRDRTDRQNATEIASALYFSYLWFRLKYSASAMLK